MNLDAYKIKCPFASSMSVQASTLMLNEATACYYSGAPVSLGYSLTQKIYVWKQDNKKVFCIETGVPANSGGGYAPETFINEKKMCFLKLHIMDTPKQAKRTMIMPLYS